MLTRTLRSAACLTAAITLFCLPAKAATSGWDLLWSNKLGQAKKSFKTEVAQNPKSADGWRGLGWTAYYEDDIDAAVIDWSRAVELAPSDWTSVGIWPLMCRMAESSQHYDAIDSAAKSLVANASAPLYLKASARLILAERVDRTVSFAAGTAARKDIGLITAWTSIGPFDNVSRSGFDTAFDPEKHIDLSATYTGIDGLPVTWRPCPLISRDGDCEVWSFLGGQKANVFYSATSVTVGADKDAVLEFSPDGASKVYVNGTLCLSNANYQIGDIDVPGDFDVPIKLRQGKNTILVKSADDTSTSEFLMAIVDPSGRAIPMSVSSSGANGTMIDSGTTLPAPSTTVVQAVLKDHAQTIEGAVLETNDLRLLNDDQDAEDAARAALKSAPNCALLHWELAQTLDDDQQSDEARAQDDAARLHTHEIAGLELAELDNDNSSAAAAKLKQARALYAEFPNSEEIVDELIRDLQGASLDAEAFDIALKCYKGDGGSYMLSRMNDLFTDGDAEIKVERLTEQAALRDPSNSSAMHNYAEDLYSKTDYKNALAWYSRLIRENPEIPTYIDREAAIDHSAGDLKGELGFDLKAIQLQPQSSGAFSNLGDTYQDLGRKSDALDAYRRASVLSPTDMDLRDKIQILTGQKPVLDLVSALPTPKISGLPAASSEPSTGFIDEEREVVYPDYTTRSEIHEMLRINDDSAVSEYQTFPLDAHSSTSTITIEQARLIKADGKIEDHTNDNDDDNNSSPDSVSFPSLAPGDIIDVSYRVDDRAEGALAHDFWNWWGFGAPEARTLQSRFVLITPRDMDYKYVSHNGAPDPTEDIEGDWRIRTWTVANGPFEKTDVMGVPERDWLPWIDISTVKSWSDIVNWYEALSAPRCTADETIKSKALELTAKAKTDDDKISAIVAYVSHDVQYQSTPFRLSAYIPTEGKEVIRERYGDCKDKAALMTAMLSVVGIKSHMVLLSPRDEGITPYLPSPRFAHAIALVDAPSGPMYIDGTADGLEYGNLPLLDQGAPALVIDPSTTDLQPTTMLPLDKDGSTIDYRGTLAADGSIKATVTLTVAGNYAWSIRSIVKQVSQDKRDDLLRGISTQVGKFDYDSGTITGESDPSQPMTLVVSGHKSDFATTAGDFLILPLPWSLPEGTEEKLDEVSDPKRKTDIEATGSGTASLHIELTLPDGYVPQDLPTAQDVQTKWHTSHFTFAFKGNTLTADWQRQTIDGRVPLADIPAYVAALRTDIQVSERKLVFKKG